jgi:NAD(P)-dependent dehydrogenase (short-subunit alcohol dehydrogenase family)
MSGTQRLAGRVGIITGAGTGVGQGIAICLAKEGMKLVIVGRTPETLQDTIKKVEAVGGTIRHVQGSIADKATAARAVADAISAYGRLDLLVNNAHTFSEYFSLEDTPADNFRTHFDSGFMGTVYFMQAAFPHMKGNGGSIINMGSVAGLEGWATMAPYNATKEAIRSLTRTASRDWGKYKIRVNVMLPGARTPTTDAYLADPEVAKPILAKIPLGYLGEAETDVGPAAVFLASDDSRYVTGETIKVDGGI